MATFEIKNYIKLLCIRLDHFESYVVDEVNTTNEEEIKEFINLHKKHKGTKILIFEMDSMEMITFEDVRKIIHNAHVFDYMRQLIGDGHKLLSVGDVDSASIGSFIKYMLEVH